MQPYSLRTKSMPTLPLRAYYSKLALLLGRRLLLGLQLLL